MAEILIKISPRDVSFLLALPADIEVLVNLNLSPL
jgi:hypothetical protein